jgi:transposase
MAKAYPLELRAKIIEEYSTSDISQRNIAKKYKVSKTYVYKLLREEKRKRYKAEELKRRSQRHLYIVKNEPQSQTI